MLGGEFVEKLDYFTSPGYLDGGNSRYEAGMPADSGPRVLISTQGTFKFDKKTKEIYLAGLHPGVSLDEVKSTVPWDLKIAQKLEPTLPPAADELDILRQFSPEISMGRKLQVEAVVNRVFRIIEKNKNRQQKSG